MSEEQAECLKDALEMVGIDLGKPREIVQEISGFTPMFDAVVMRYKDETRAAVHGAMWRFCQMSDGVCRASLETIAEMIGISAATAMRHAEELVKDGYFVDMTPDLKNRPHVYADTGAVKMKSKLDVHISQRNTGISQRNVGVSESQLSKVLNKDINKQGGKPPIDPSTLPIDWQMLGDKPVVLPDEKLAKQKDAASLVGMGMGVLAEPAAALALAFQTARGVVFTESQIKGQRKAAKALIEQKITPALVTAAVKKLLAAGMTVTDLYSITKTAIDLANKNDVPKIGRTLPEIG